jgi:nicotinamide-nucleotide amidase
MPGRSGRRKGGSLGPAAVLPRIQQVGSRAGIVVTGTEVLTGRVTDRNGPWLAEQLRVLGVDIAQIVVVGDRPADLQESLAFLANTGLDLVFTSGGLGPTADDLTAELVGTFQGRTSSLDPELERHISEIVERLSAGRGWRLDPAATAAGTRKQALVPVGAAVLAPVGTAPGLIVPPAEGRGGPPIVVLPGPPRELQGMWPAVLADPVVQAALGGREELRQRTIRLWGTPESELAATLREHAAELTGLEITTCLRDGELEIVTRYGAAAEPAYDEFEAVVGDVYSETVFSSDGRTIDDVVAEGLLAEHLTISTAESCTGGLLAARLTERPGSSAYVIGGLVTYANEAKHDLAEVPAELIERVGAVSAEVAQAMADGVRARLGTDIGVGITGVAGPGGGTPDKPVGLVHLCASRDGRAVARKVRLPGDRSDVRARAVVLAMHMIRELLAG